MSSSASISSDSRGAYRYELPLSTLKRANASQTLLAHTSISSSLISKNFGRSKTALGVRAYGPSAGKRFSQRLPLASANAVSSSQFRLATYSSAMRFVGKVRSLAVAEPS